MEKETKVVELSFLYAIPRTQLLDTIFLAITKISGSYGQLWLIVGLALLIPKKTRMTGITVLLSWVFASVFCHFILKNLINRPRPCDIDRAFALLVERPNGSSFPSAHSAQAFAASTAIFVKYRKAGIAAFVAAALIAFSRMYMFLHFPTDVLCGIVVGVLVGIAADRICDMVKRKSDRRKIKTDA